MRHFSVIHLVNSSQRRVYIWIYGPLPPSSSHRQRTWIHEHQTGGKTFIDARA
jgi:hypothetical protein